MGGCVLQSTATTRPEIPCPADEVANDRRRAGRGHCPPARVTVHIAKPASGIAAR